VKENKGTPSLELGSVRKLGIASRAWGTLFQKQEVGKRKGGVNLLNFVFENPGRGLLTWEVGIIMGERNGGPRGIRGPPQINT